MWANPRFLSAVLDHVLGGIAQALPSEANSLVIVFSQVLLRNLAKPAQHVPVVEFTLLEIAGAAERNSTGMTKQPPLPLRRLDRSRGVSAVNAFPGNKNAVDEVESQGHEVSDFSHRCPLCRSPACRTAPSAGYNPVSAYLGFRGPYANPCRLITDRDQQKR
jgi:hypothetical protein